MHTEAIQYTDQGTTLEAYVACDTKVTGRRPGVLVAHAWAGRDAFAQQKAHALAELGYVGFALDMYGRGVLGSGPDENAKLMQPFMEDRAMLRRRMGEALHALREHDAVDPQRIGAIGFCFGGLCVLDLARAGAPVRGVVSFHGLLQGPETLHDEKITAKVLALHGYDDPFAPPDQLAAFAQEMTAHGVDWQAHIYGRTLHAFTNPDANDPAMGTVYDRSADQRSWAAMCDFFEETLA